MDKGGENKTRIRTILVLFLATSTLAFATPVVFAEIWPCNNYLGCAQGCLTAGADACEGHPVYGGTAKRN